MLVSFSAMEFKTKPSKKFDLPKRIARLGEVAYNLWWTWQPESSHLFGKLDYDLWERLGHNPVRFLQGVSRKRLSQFSKDKDYLNLYDGFFKKFDAYITSPAWTQENHPEFKSWVE